MSARWRELFGLLPVSLLVTAGFAAVLTHARYEERYEFPQLRAKVPADRLRTAAQAVRAAEAVAPTRPHPSAQSATANVVVGPPLAVFDRARDLIRDAVRRSDS